MRNRGRHICVPLWYTNMVAETLRPKFRQKWPDFTLKCIAITSHHITSHHITSHHITSHHITSHHITSHHITSKALPSLTREIMRKKQHFTAFEIQAVRLYVCIHLPIATYLGVDQVTNVWCRNRSFPRYPIFRLPSIRHSRVIAFCLVIYPHKTKDKKQHFLLYQRIQYEYEITLNKRHSFKNIDYSTVLRLSVESESIIN